MKQTAWEGKGYGFNAPQLMYSLGRLSRSVEICCVSVTVETGNRERRSHHVHHKPVQLCARWKKQRVDTEQQELREHFLTTMSDWAALLLRRANGSHTDEKTRRRKRRDNFGVRASLKLAVLHVCVYDTDYEPYQDRVSIITHQ